MIYAGSKHSAIKKIGYVVICYAVGLLIGNINILPEDVYSLQDMITTITIPLAIPLLMFSENIKKWFGMARKTFISLLLGLVSVIIMVIIGNVIFRDLIPESWKISGMLIGVYSGGTPNLAAISKMLEVDEDMYILTHTTDLVIGAFVLLFLLTIGQRFFLLFMDKYKKEDNMELENSDPDSVQDFESYEGILKPEILKPLLLALGLSILIFAIGGGLSLIVGSDYQMVVAILTITTLGIVASLNVKVNAIQKTFPLGMYFILVFSLVVASMADLREMFSQGQSVVLMSLFLFIILAVIGSLMLHAILSKIFKIDADHFIVASVALSMSPPFVPVVAAALKNRAVVLPGLILGIIGYALGNYLGVFLAYILR